ncbi:MAG TPA: hypothetical protein VFP06_04045 [Acidimicrobiales bacterium]|nr:hypothetical protein [Acidimicrobiales bacterium]
MAAFKDEISAELAAHLARELTRAWPAFPRRRFTRGLDDALAPLALMARIDLLTDRLVDALPDDFDIAAKVLWETLESLIFTGWMTLPCGSYVARAGIDRPEIGLPLLAGLTPRWSSEGPVRPFLERHPDITYRHLHRWVLDPDEHVRRLVTEGTRPRLPWAPQLRRLIADPSPNIELLDHLVDDPSAYVRRSVANHLNDISASSTSRSAASAPAGTPSTSRSTAASSAPSTSTWSTRERRCPAPARQVRSGASRAGTRGGVPHVEPG